MASETTAHFALLAEALPNYVLAPDLLGHGFSPWEPPWDIETHCAAIADTVGPEPAALVGHSFGGRLAFELAARARTRAEARAARSRDPPPPTSPCSPRRTPASPSPTSRSTSSSSAATRASSSERRAIWWKRTSRAMSCRTTTAATGTATAGLRSWPHTAKWPRRRALRGRSRSDTPRPRRALVPSYDHLLDEHQAARRPARGRRRPGRALRSLGRVRGDRWGDRGVPRALATELGSDGDVDLDTLLERGNVDPLDLRVRTLAARAEEHGSGRRGCEQGGVGPVRDATMSGSAPRTVVAWRRTVRTIVSSSATSNGSRDPRTRAGREVRIVRTGGDDL